MVSRAQKIRLGVFLTFATLALIATIAVVTGSKLLKRQVTYFIRYHEISLTGLEVGSVVRYRGIRIGRIEDIYIDEKDITSIIVEITVDSEVPIKEDTEAVVTLLGITGLKIIELHGGSNESKRLASGSFIKPGLSLVDAISGQAEVMAQKLELILNNLAELTDAEQRQRLMRLVENTSNTLESFNNLMASNQSNITGTLKNVATISAKLDTFVLISNQTLQDIRKITQSPKLMATVDHVESISGELAAANLSELIKKLASAIEQTDRTFTHLDMTLLKSRHDILSSTEILRESLENFNEFTRLISENPSLLLRSSPQAEIRE